MTHKPDQKPDPLLVDIIREESAARHKRGQRHPDISAGADERRRKEWGRLDQQQTPRAGKFQAFVKAAGAILAWPFRKRPAASAAPSQPARARFGGRMSAVDGTPDKMEPASPHMRLVQSDQPRQ